MLSANIATLKAKLSFYIGQVKQGHEVIVLDRHTPVARIAPSGPATPGLVLVAAAKSAQSLRRMRVRRVKRAIDAVALLRQDRDRR